MPTNLFKQFQTHPDPYDEDHDQISLTRRIEVFLKYNFSNIIYILLLVALVIFSVWSVKIPFKQVNPLPATFSDSVTDSSETAWAQTAFVINSEDTVTVDTNEVDKKATIATPDVKIATDKPNKTHSQPPVKQSSPAPKKRQRTVQKRSLSTRPKPALTKSTRKPAPAKHEVGTGFLRVVVSNAQEYGYGYVYVDGIIWKKGGYNTTPINLELPVGNHKIEVRRENFSVSPPDTLIRIKKNVSRQLSFKILPKKKLTLNE